jgi:hypothetical protein
MNGSMLIKAGVAFVRAPVKALPATKEKQVSKALVIGQFLFIITR